MDQFLEVSWGIKVQNFEWKLKMRILSQVLHSFKEVEEKNDSRKKKSLERVDVLNVFTCLCLKSMFYFLWCLEALNGWHVAFRRGFFP